MAGSFTEKQEWVAYEMLTEQKILIYITAGSLVGLKKVIEELFFPTT